MERTLIIFKPDSVQRGLVGRIYQRFEDKGFKMVGLKLISVSEELAGKHYGEHKDKPFYGELISYITSNPVIVAAVEGEQAISVVRKMMGATFGFNAEPGTIRGDFSNSKQNNLIHGSATADDAKRELALYFSDDELCTYESSLKEWLQ